LVEYYHRQRPDLARAFFSTPGQSVEAQDISDIDLSGAEPLILRRAARTAALIQQRLITIGGLNVKMF